MTYYIGACQSRWNSEGNTGTSKFTTYEYDDDNRVIGARSVEVETTFDPVSKEWSTKIVRQWEGTF